MKLITPFGAAILALALLAAGCGSSNPAAKLPGAKVFASAGCSSCHTLKAVHAKGQIGPDLDALKPDAATVAHQVRLGGNGMPSFGKRLSSTQISQVAAFVAAASRSSGKTPAFKADNTTIQECEHSSKPFCFRQAFGNIAYRDGPDKALALLATDDQSMSSVHGDCHQIAHWIGHASLAHYHGNAAEALAHGAMTCFSGYYHGVIERSFAGLPRSEVIAKARRLCSASGITKEQFLIYQCVHGLGHGLMIYSGDDLPWALRACHQLLNDYDRISCTGGVFMQNLDTTMIASRYLKKKNPIYPCTIVGQADKLYCYLMVTSRISTVDGYNWRKTAAWCRRVEKGWVATCFQSFGRDASGFSRYVPAKTVRLCAYAGSEEDQCLYGAARDYGSNYAGGKQASEVCNLSSARYRAHCFEGIGTILGGLNRSSAQRRSACDEVTPPRYRADCYRGAVA
jgi:mono/diheme cytochrome c family protein